MIIKADNKQAAEKLKALKTLMVENGAWFHDRLTVIISGSDVRVEMTGPTVHKMPILQVLEDLLVPYHAANMTVKDNLLYCDPNLDILSPVQAEIIQHVIDFFNLTKKISAYQEQWIAPKYKQAPALFEPLFAAKSEMVAETKIADFVRGEAGSMSEEEFLCWCFFQSRFIGKGDESGKMNLYVMPIIDFLNHDYRGSSFAFKDGSLLVKNVQPFSGRCECYAAYGRYDTLDLFLSYGFIDTNIPYTVSVPMEIKVFDSCLLKIENRGIHRTNQRVPSKLSDLKGILPKLRKQDDGTFSIPHLLIPATTMPHSMRRVLHALITTIMENDSSPELIVDNVYRLEKEIINTNVQFYEDVLEKIQDMEAPKHLKDEVVLVATTQLNKLYKYPYQNDFF